LGTRHEQGLIMWSVSISGNRTVAEHDVVLHIMNHFGLDAHCPRYCHNFTWPGLVWFSKSVQNQANSFSSWRYFIIRFQLCVEFSLMTTITYGWCLLKIYVLYVYVHSRFIMCGVCCQF